MAIATPVHTHFEIALAALKAGKHVLVEKPMTDSPEQAALLVEEAAKRRLTLMVDHTFVYTGAIQAIRGLVDARRARRHLLLRLDPGEPRARSSAT